MLPLAVGLLGAAFERLALRRVHRHGHVAELLFTFGLSFVVLELVQLVWGRSSVDYRVPQLLEGPIATVFGIAFPAYRAFMMLVSLAMLAALAWLLARTRTGLLIRAALTHPHMVQALGHDLPKIHMGVFGGGCALAGLAGAAGYYYVIQPRMTAPTAVKVPSSAATTDAAAASQTQLAAVIPEFKLADSDGTLRSLKDDWKGKALIVNFWATWCAPCRREIPLLNQLAADRAKDNFQVVGIAIDFRDKVLAYAQEMQIDYPMLIGEQDALDAAAAFGVDAVGLPFTIFTDTSGRVIALHMGELTADEADLILSAVADVNSGQTDPAQARQAIATALAALPPTTEQKSGG